MRDIQLRYGPSDLPDQLRAQVMLSQVLDPA